MRPPSHVFRLAALIACFAALATSLGASATARTAQADDGVSPYRVTELPIRVGPSKDNTPVISGKWLTWQDANTPGRIPIRAMDSGNETAIDVPGDASWPPSVDGDWLVDAEADGGDTGDTASSEAIVLYHLPDGARTVIAAPSASGVARSTPSISGDFVVWLEGQPGAQNVFAYDRGSGQVTKLTDTPANREAPSVSGNVVAWLDRRDSPSGSTTADVYAYDLTNHRELRLTAQPGNVGWPTASNGRVFWTALVDQDTLFDVYDLATSKTTEFLRRPSSRVGVSRLSVDGNVVVWDEHAGDDDVYGYDLQKQVMFVISRAIGDQSAPSISGTTVVWADSRSSGAGKYEFDSDIYGAHLESGPAPVPSVVGAPQSTDARIEIVWPHGGAPVTEASLANLEVWLFNTGTKNLAACQWNPVVQLWEATDNQPAKLVGTGQKNGDQFRYQNRGVPSWEFNDVDVSTANDPSHRIYFLVSLDGTPSRTSVWAHGADPRTYFPEPDVPTGISSSPDAVDARIEIVWPHDDVPVDEAKLVNVTAMLFKPGTLESVPPDYDRTVTLYSSFNNDVGAPMAMGAKRVIQKGDLSYPVWDFNNVDVSKAIDPANKYFFTLVVDGVKTYTNVWAHGADPRTHFPEMDTPTASCG